MEKVVHIVSRKHAAAEEDADLRYWLSRPAAERIAAVELLRQQFIAEHYDVEPGLRRVYRVTQLHRG